MKRYETLTPSSKAKVLAAAKAGKGIHDPISKTLYLKGGHHWDRPQLHDLSRFLTDLESGFITIYEAWLREVVVYESVYGFPTLKGFDSLERDIRAKSLQGKDLSEGLKVAYIEGGIISPLKDLIERTLTLGIASTDLTDLSIFIAKTKITKVFNRDFELGREVNGAEVIASINCPAQSYVELLRITLICNIYLKYFIINHNITLDESYLRSVFVSAIGVGLNGEKFLKKPDQIIQDTLSVVAGLEP